jgi:hypothetical protein
VGVMVISILIAVVLIIFVIPTALAGLLLLAISDIKIEK